MPLPICPLIRGVWRAEKRDIGFQTCLMEVINEIQRCDASASAVLGATVTLPFLSFFRRVGDEWVFFDEPLQNILDIFEGLGRPLVFQLSCNHLSRRSPLVNSLMEDRSNLMEFSNGTHPHDRYLGTQVSPLTLLTDPEIQPRSWGLSPKCLRCPTRMNVLWLLSCARNWNTSLLLMLETVWLRLSIYGLPRLATAVLFPASLG
jgi:hypothetical protein